MRRILSVCFFLHGINLCAAQGIIVNECSNGFSGNREYIELLVTGPNCTPLDLRNWIIDDNNGDFSGGPIVNAGISNGHVRLRDLPQWQTVPVGAIILLYNPDDKNPSIILADDPSDADNDSLYVLPLSDPSLEFTLSLPTFTTSAYSPATYVQPPVWSAVEIRNEGDAVQVRRPNGNYFFGISYGATGYNINGGPDNLKIFSSDGSRHAFAFTNTGGNNFLLASNWNTFPVMGENDGVNQTPGLPNNAANGSYINFLRNCSSFPVTISSFEGTFANGAAALFWECNVQKAEGVFQVLRSSADGVQENIIGEVEIRQNETGPYLFVDRSPEKGANYYRFSWTDESGVILYSPFVEINTPESGEGFYVFPNPAPAGIQLIPAATGANAAGQVSVRIFALTGQECFSVCLPFAELQAALTKRSGALLPGIYFIEIRTSDKIRTAKFIKL